MSSSQGESPASSSAGTNAPKSNKGRPKGSQGESLIKRSKEVLGLDRVKDIQRRRKSTKDSHDPTSKATTRREQVLEAQRTHRMRTKIYIKELESEVLRLRKSEATAKAKAELFERKTQALLEVLHEHGIQPPGESAPSQWSPSPPQLRDYGSGMPPMQNLSIQQRSAGMGGRQNVSGQGGATPYTQPPQEAPLQLLPDNGDVSIVPSLFVSPERLPQASQQVDPATPFFFDDSQAELDFILTLERPCMAHLHASHFGPHAPPFDAQAFLTPGARPAGSTEDEAEAVFSGHVLTASMPVWQELRQRRPRREPPNLARSELRHLLNTSYQLGLRDEIAPIQVLEIVRTRAESKVITVRDLRNLAQELVTHLNCYGFGAVFNVEIVKNLVLKYC